MSAVLKSEARFEPLNDALLEAVLQVEKRAYSHPWTRGNFVDSQQAGYQVQLLLCEQQLLGYFVAMEGVQEVHLLNITVAPDFQRQGWARLMLDALCVPTVMMERYSWSTKSATSGVEPEVTLRIVVSRCCLSPGLMRSGL